ncbi:hypothetical protein, partial [Pseudomonas sp. FW305-BF6]|uniref:hypothetical protein n=1 Tax=Pseudomonas sp. FW305-BF6 TaxID=2070673 RepID=UPI001C4978BA
LVHSNIEVIGLSRSMNDHVDYFEKMKKNIYTHLQIDLCNRNEIETIFKGIIQKLIMKQPKKVYVINNAGMVEPIERLGFLDANLIEKA